MAISQVSRARGAGSHLKKDWREVSERRGGMSPRGSVEVIERQAVRWPIVQRAVTAAFHKVYYYNHWRTWMETKWLGHEMRKLPLDVWIYQELIAEIRPALIIETGTRFGGSALFMAHVCDLIGHGRVVTVDITLEETPRHDRITYLTGSSTDPRIVAQIRAMLPEEGEPVMVVLDSDHRTPHVRDELAAYTDFVTVGSYLIVEDTNTGGNPVEHREVPNGGPLDAVRELLAGDDRFEVDFGRERYFLTQNPSGYLRRVGGLTP